MRCKKKILLEIGINILFIRVRIFMTIIVIYLLLYLSWTDMHMLQNIRIYIKSSIVE